MLKTIGKVGAAVAILAAVAVGSAAIAGAAQNNASTTQNGPPSVSVVGDGDHDGPHGNHKPESPLPGTTATKVRNAALGKVPGGSIIRVETNTDGGGPYEAHLRKPDGSQVVVLVQRDFTATAVEPFGPPRG
jgi:hypothetical protein